MTKLDLQQRANRSQLTLFTSFSEPGSNADGKSEPVWFALNEDRPLMFFAGVWTNWTSARKVKEGEVNADFYGFLTIEPIDVVGAIHPKAMPVILQTPGKVETWLTAPWEDAGALQRAPPDGVLEIVAFGDATDE
ncbi:SOS response-associated peptidase family protein [Ruegeria sp. 2205SS24-7]|uniref:SOS response-associated peptidase family protein n=1 Tax=Ruegeria discodermiae TaxID=3064389 RepID=UPI0027411AFE|nr:SOS response-associated peptidase family protein [Ruegeria sp. 2205SS24-7]MDP5219297.1 SOS response-associated peptidase family protein [Ruegeria sp. 2205SS24-7]